MTETPEAPPCIQEQYATAVGSSNLRVLNDANRRNIADLIIAAGMNPHRLGLALRRLATEWDSVGKPLAMSAESIEAMAAKYPRIEGTGLVLVKTIHRSGKVIEERLLPLVAAKREADAWHASELALLFQRLKTLPEVRGALVHWAEARQIEGAVHVVGALIQWWLSPKCVVCHGVMKRVVLGTGRTSSKNCRECRGTGEARVPHGSVGRKLLGHIRECLGASAHNMRLKNRG